MDSRVTVILLHGELVTVAVPAEDLERLADREDGHLGRIALGHRRQDVQQQRVVLLLLPLERHEVILERTLHQQRQRTLDDRALEQQHPLHIGMLYDRYLGLRGVF